jgi:hypothetical protein
VELEKEPPEALAQRVSVPVVVTEMDSTYLKRQQRGHTGPVQEFTGNDATEYQRLMSYEHAGAASWQRPSAFKINQPP